MKRYGPYLLFQIARFGALTIPQMLRICEGKCKRSALYRSLGELVKGGLVYPIVNPATRTRAYYATKNGREFVLGKSEPLTTGVKACELDHTLKCAEVLLNLSSHENVTGVSTHFELGPADAKRFCYDRIPDGIIRLTQNGEHAELAVEVEHTVRSTSRVSELLDQYWATFRRGMDCYGLLLVGSDKEVLRRYNRALEQMPSEFKERAKILEGDELKGLNLQAFGVKRSGSIPCLDFTRTTFLDEIAYTPAKAQVFVSQSSCTAPTPRDLGP